MNIKNSVFLRLHLKKTFKLLPIILLVSAILLASISVAAYALLLRQAGSENNAMASVAIVGDQDDSYLGIGIKTIKAFDESKEYLDVYSMDEDEAMKALESRKVNGVLTLPDGYIEDIMYGKNTPAKFIYMDGPRGLGTIMMHEIVGDISNFVTRTQTAVYTLRSSMRHVYALELLQGSDESLSEFNERLDKHTMDINFEFFDLVINRSNLFNLQYVGSVSELSFAAYYLCALIILFLLIWGMSCNRMLSRKNFDFSRLMCRQGIGSKLQIFYEYLSFLLATVLVLLLCAVIFGIIIPKADLGIREIENANAFSAIFFIIKALPAIMTITMMHFMIYEIFSNPISALLAEFLIAIGLSYVSGCLYPISFFPEAVQKFSAFLPSGAAFSYIRKLLSGSNLLLELLLLVLYTLAFYAIATLVRNVKIKGVSR